MNKSYCYFVTEYLARSHLNIINSAIEQTRRKVSLNYCSVICGSMKQTKSRLFRGASTFGVFFALTIPVLADQCAYINKEEAVKAIARLDKAVESKAEKEDYEGS